MKKIALLLPIVAILSACATTHSTDVATSVPVTQASQNWTTIIPAHKAALRSCIIANKDIQSIANIDAQPEATTLTVATKNASLLNCSVNPRTNQVTTITPITDANLPSSNKFYPVGKRLPEPCRGNERIHDEEGRLMGILCY